jgi:hypothetical protein
MLKGLFYVVVSAFIFAPCVGLLVFSIWLAGDRQKSSGDDNYAGLSPLTSEEAVELIKPADMQPRKAVPRVVESHIAAVHAGATLIRRPPVKVVQTNTAAVHAGATLIKLPPAPLGVSANLRTPPSKLTPPKFAQTNTGAIPPASAPNPKRKKITLPSVAANASTGAATRKPEAKGSKVSPKAADPQIEQNQQAAGRTIVTRKQRKPRVARVTTEPPVSVKPIVRKRKDSGDVTVANIVELSIDATDPDHRDKSSTPKPGGNDRRRLPVATSRPPPVKTKNWRTRVSDGNEVRRAVGQLNDKDRRAFRSRCRQILSAPEKFARRHIEICTAASL